MNFNNTIGAVGFTSMIAPFVYPVTLIKVDKDTNEIIRDSDGVCVRAKPGESKRYEPHCVRGFRQGPIQI